MTIENRIEELSVLLRKDSRLLSMIEALVSAYEKTGDPYHDLPKSIQNKLKESILQVENGEAVVNDTVLAEARTKYKMSD